MPCFMLLAHASHSPPRSAPKLSRFFEFLVWQQVGRASREAGTPSCEDSQTSDVDPIRGLSQHGPTAHRFRVRSQSSRNRISLPTNATKDSIGFTVLATQIPTIVQKGAALDRKCKQL